MRLYQTGVIVGNVEKDGTVDVDNDFGNLNLTSISGSVIITDIGASTNMMRAYGGDVAELKDASDISRKVGLIFYDHGTVVLDLRKVMSGSQYVSGTIDAMNATSPGGSAPVGSMFIGGLRNRDLGEGVNPNAKFIPDFLVSASLDNIIDHIAQTRMQSGSLTAMTFQNVTNINSTLYFCRAGADDFNYSSNPTYKDSQGRIVVIDPGMDTTQRSFTFPTTVGLHDALGNLLAVAKLSRPIEKNDEKDITFRIRLDY